MNCSAGLGFACINCFVPSNLHEGISLWAWYSYLGFFAIELLASPISAEAVDECFLLALHWNS